MKISSSPDRHTFQKESYIRNCKKKNETISEEYLKVLDTFKVMHDSRFNDPKSREYNLEYDLLTTDWILEKVRSSEVYAQHIYAALCNNDFMKNEVWPILNDNRWGCSWRSAGGIVADMRQHGDYIDWYCSGQSNNEKYVREGNVTDEVREDLLKLGWLVKEINDSDADKY